MPQVQPQKRKRKKKTHDRKDNSRFHNTFFNMLLFLPEIYLKKEICDPIDQGNYTRVKEFIFLGIT